MQDSIFRDQGGVFSTGSTISVAPFAAAQATIALMVSAEICLEFTVMLPRDITWLLPTEFVPERVMVPWPDLKKVESALK
jgi:hypothetical protein